MKEGQGLGQEKNRDVLFGVIAVQMRLLTPTDLAAATARWSDHPETGLDQTLIAMGLIALKDKAMVEQLMARQLEVHGADASATLASFGGGAAVHESFAASLIWREDGEIESTVRAGSEESLLGFGGDPKSTVEVARRAHLDDPEHITLEHPGRYQLKQEFGRGAIGRVLVALDGHIGREVAMKELLPAWGGGTTSASVNKTHAALRFLREARITGQLEHPGIVPVYEIGRRRDGSSYYTMKLVRGVTMADKLKKCEDLRARLRLLPNFLDVCQAVAYAHSKTVIHRDLKPANTMVGEFGETVVLDWGLAKYRDAKEVAAEDSESSSPGRELIKETKAGETVRGQAIGTPAYMSPEQAMGKVDEVDERSDVWALGAMLYELLTGRTPFTGDNAYEVMGKVMVEEPAPILAVEPKAPPELAAIAHRCLTKDREKRYRTAGSVAEDLQNFQAGYLVSAYDYKVRDLLVRFVVRHWLWFALGLVLLILGGVAVAAGVTVSREKERSVFYQMLSTITEAQALAKEGEAEQGERKLTKFVEDYPNYAPGLNARATFYIDLKQYDQAIKDSDAAIVIDPMYPYGYFTRGMARHKQKEYDLAIADFNHVLKLVPTYAAAYYNRGFSNVEKKAYDQAIADYEAAIRLDPKDAAAYNFRGIAFVKKAEQEKKDDPQQATTDYERAFADYGKALEILPSYHVALYNRANAYWKRGELDLAIKDFDATIELKPNYTDAYYNRHFVLKKKGDIKAAIADLEKTVMLEPKTSKYLNALAWELATNADPEVRDGARAVELAERVAELTEWKNPGWLDTLAAAYAEAGRVEDAVKWEQTAIDLFRAANDEKSAADCESRLKLYQAGQPFHEAK